MRIHRGTSHLGRCQHPRVLGIGLAFWLCASSFLLIHSSAAAAGTDLSTDDSATYLAHNPNGDSGIRASTAITYFTFFPVVGKALNCQSIPGAIYGSVLPSTPPVGVAPPVNPEYNLSLRGYDPTSASLEVGDYYGGGSDPAAPKLYSVFAGSRPVNFSPPFQTVYRVHKWDYGCGCASADYEDDSYPVTLGGMAATPGELVLTPASGYDIGLMTTGYEVMVLYASPKQLTLRYGREDDIRGDLAGYVIHLENVCVDPNLLAWYHYWDSAGRSRLPALYAGQPVGRAILNEVGVAVRDWAMFMDPRSKKDWW